MNIEKLKTNLENDKELNIYLKGINNIVDNTNCIINENNKWQVFYYERELYFSSQYLQRYISFSGSVRTKI